LKNYFGAKLDFFLSAWQCLREYTEPNIGYFNALEAYFMKEKDFALIGFGELRAINKYARAWGNKVRIGSKFRTYMYVHADGTRDAISIHAYSRQKNPHHVNIYARKTSADDKIIDDTNTTLMGYRRLEDAAGLLVKITGKMPERRQLRRGMSIFWSRRVPAFDQL
jgi:hypothetical protein